MWAATWPTDPATLRTLTNSGGVTALAVFTDEEQLHDAAMRYAWLGLDGKAPSKKLHISEAMRFAKQHRAQVVVVDIAADHALELDEGEMELLASPPSGRPPSYSGMPPVRTNRPPGEEGPPLSLSQLAMSAMHAPSHHGLEPMVTNSEAAASVARAVSASSLQPAPDMTARGQSQTSLAPTSMSEAPSSVSVSFGSSGSAQLTALPEPPSEEVYDALTAVLRDFPEVEWACVVRASRGPGEATPAVGLRIDPAFRKNLNEISVKMRETSIEYGIAFDMLLLDTPEQMKAARQIGRPFYPWRKKG